MIIIYVDILLLIILLLLVMFTCGYCVYRVHQLQQNGQATILLKPTRVLFSHRKEGESNAELRTVVAYRNPFTGDYCVHKSRVEPKGYINSVQIPDSPDSGVSDEYEPLNLVPQVCEKDASAEIGKREYQEPLKQMNPAISDNSVNKTWNWNYTEYQI
ncbi:unnamed protein product [Parnassius apollo]|uniref:(apollo) hypothetical protein n=1 Tax=Parnassius apollo TaxID=110799 RepID=A0A8S3Y9Q6_PARAO|nr:unnamed protein product [Parnassius apollo]